MRVDRQNGEGEFGLGYDRIVGTLSNLGDTVSDQTVGNVLKRHGIAPAPKRSQNTTWKEFIQSHLAVLAGIDFFTVEVLTWRGLMTYYVLFFIHLESRRVSLAGITRHPDQEWMQQMARNATSESWGFLDQRRYVLHDRNTKFCLVFRADASGWRDKTGSTPSAQPQFEFSCWQVCPQNPVLGCQIFVLEEKFLIDQAGHIRQQPRPRVLFHIEGP